MASYEYKVETEIGGKWLATTIAKINADQAVRFCRIDWPTTARGFVGAKARIMRRRGPRSEWLPYREYEIDDRMMVKRTDR